MIYRFPSADMPLSPLLPVRYVDNGRDIDRDGGLDCWGFFRVARSVLGLSVPPVFLIPQGEARANAFALGRISEEWTRLDSPKPHALALVSGGIEGEHCGIVLSDSRTIMHCSRYGVCFCSIEVFRRLGREIEYYEYNGKKED